MLASMERESEKGRPQCDQFLQGIASVDGLHFSGYDRWNEKEALSSKFLSFFQLFQEDARAADQFLDGEPGALEGYDSVGVSCFWPDAIGPDHDAETVGVSGDQEAGDSDDGGLVGCRGEPPIFEIFSAPSAEEVASILGPCPSPSLAFSAEELTMSEGSASPDDENFLQSCLMDDQDSSGELHANSQVACQHGGTDEELWAPLFSNKTCKKPRSVKKMARHRAACNWKASTHVHMPSVSDEGGACHVPLDPEVVDVKSVLGMQWGSPVFSDHELVKVLVAMGQLEGEPQLAALLNSLDCMIQKDLYDCTESFLQELACTQRSPVYFLARTVYSDGGTKNHQVTRLRSPPVRRGSRKHGSEPFRRWMQRGKSKIFNIGSAEYGKTYFSYGLRDSEGRTQRRKTQNRRLVQIHDSDSDSQDVGTQSVQRRRSAQNNKVLQSMNQFQAYELYLKEDMDKDSDNRRQNKGPKPYWVICVLKYDNSQWSTEEVDSAS